MKILLIVILGVVVLWSIGWFALATALERQMDRALHELDGRTEVACRKRSIGGFPFRIEVRCGPNSFVRTPQFDLGIEGLTAVGMIYNPNRVILEARAPFSYQAEGISVRSDWDAGQMSANFGLADLPDVAVRRVDVSLKDVTAALAGDVVVPDLRAGDAQLHLRSNPDNEQDLDVAVSLASASLGVVGPFDLAMVASVEGGSRLLRGDTETLLRSVMTEGLVTRISELTLGAEGTKLSVTGDVRLGSSGLVDGELEVAIAGTEVPYLDVFVDPALADQIETFLSSLVFFGRETTVAGDPARAFTVSVEGGNVRAGIIPLGRIPALAVLQ